MNDIMQMNGMCVMKYVCVYVYMHLNPLYTIFRFFNRMDIKMKIEIKIKIENEVNN